MAASLFGRGFLPHHSRRVLCQTFVSLRSRLLSSDDRGKGSERTTGYGANKNADLSNNKTIEVPDASSTPQPVVDSVKNVNFTATTESTNVSSETGALEKFARVIEKVKKAQEDEASLKEKAEDIPAQEDPNESFASMLRKSKLVSLGEHQGRLVEGTVFEVMGDDLYVDFGGKFHCVCPRPKRNAERYHRGTKVLLSLQCMEMSSAFLGSDIHVTLLEGDGTLLGLSSSERQKRSTSVKF